MNKYYDIKYSYTFCETGIFCVEMFYIKVSRQHDDLHFMYYLHKVDNNNDKELQQKINWDEI